MSTQDATKLVDLFKPPCNFDRNMEKKRFIYFITSGEFTKVGMTTDLQKRLLSFQAGNPHEMTLSHYRSVPSSLANQVERLIHQKLGAHSVGREWFRIEARVALSDGEPFIKASWAAERKLLNKIEAKRFERAELDELEDKSRPMLDEYHLALLRSKNEGLPLPELPSA